MAQWDNQVTSNGEQYYSDSSVLLVEANSIPNYAYCLPEYAGLDGNFVNVPDVISTKNNGYISTYVSDDNGYFAQDEQPVLNIKFDRDKTSDGIILTFNTASGDYCTELTIEWLKDGDVMATETFYPDAVTYLCSHKISVFNEVNIIFSKTSRPNRYIWVGYIENRRLTDAGGLKIVYEDVALVDLENIVLTATNMRSDANIRNILNYNQGFPNFAMAYDGYAILNSDFVNVPVDLSAVPFIGSTMSDENGEFAVSDRPTIDMDLTGGTYSSVGLTFTFNDASPEDYVTEMTIQWSRTTGGTTEVLLEQDFYPSSSNFFAYAPVEYYNHIKIIFKKTSKPYRPVFLTEVLFGLYRIFNDDEAYNVDCNMEVNEISESISSNTLNFSVKTESPYRFIFQKKQHIYIYFDEKLLGRFYLKSGSKKTIWDYDIESHDIIGVLDGNKFYGGIYTNKSVNELISEILQDEDTEWFLDQSFSSTRVSGYLPIGTKRQALQQIAFAIGAIINSSYDRPLQIYPVPTLVTANFPLSETFLGLSVDSEDIVTGVSVNSHQYTQSTESVELFKGTMAAGESITVEFSEPAHTLSVSPSASVTFTGNANYAIITNNGAAREIVLSGRKYNHQIITVTKQDQNITAFKNVLEVQDATLVSPNNVQSVVDRLYDYYRSNETISAKVRIKEQELGELATITSNFDGTKEGLITGMDFIFTKELNANITIK